jgi:hypothetical protein
MARQRWTLVGCMAVVGLLVAGSSVGPAWADNDKACKKTEKKVTIEQVPAAVKATILKEAGSNAVKEIEEVSKEGSIVFFEAEWKTDGKEVEIKVAPDGKLLGKKIETDDGDDDEDDDD